MRKSVLVAGVAVGLCGMSSIAVADGYERSVGYAPRAWSWTGCYIGVEGGGIWGSASNTSFDTTFGPAFVGPITGNYDLSGSMAGGTIGCNYQTGAFVLGIEADDSWTNNQGSSFAIAPFNRTALIQTQENWIATFRGRLGYAFAPRWLAYVTGGAAATDASLTIKDPNGLGGSGAEASDSNTRWGWTVGAGTEWAVAGRWSFKAEYLHADFGNSDYFTPNVRVSKPDGHGGTFNYTFVSQSVNLTDDMVRVGLNYGF